MDYLGLSFDPLDEDAVAALLRHRPAAAPFAYLVTPNVDHVVRLSKRPADGEEWRAYRDAAWRLCDSRILAKLARLRGIRLPVVPGSDLTARLFRDILARGDRLCLIGGEAGDAAALEALSPGVAVVQYMPPTGLLADRPAMVAAARFAAGSHARFILLAVGSPQQELVARMIAEVPGSSGTALCVGASVDFLVGRTKRAPRWMRSLSLEWLHRLLGDPVRLWRRYLIDGPRIFLLAWRFRR